jgi:transcriptional pleiotropic regulator of transition state genes
MGMKGEADIMKSTGIVRKVDELGRIVLPIELRRTLDIAERDELEIFMENDRIVLQKYEPSCVFCASSNGLVTYRGKNVCRECARNMGKV